MPWDSSNPISNLSRSSIGDEAQAASIETTLGIKLAAELGVYRIPEGFKLSVVIPVYNEIKTLSGVVARLRATRLPLEIVIVDDGSRDGTRDLLASWQNDVEGNRDLVIILHEKNRGKGGALRTGFSRCTGSVVVVQDADDEYDPQDFRKLLQPIVAGDADVVYGSRFTLIDGPVQHYWHRAANLLITKLSNWRSGRALTDVETCYKMIRRELIEQIGPTLRENGFGIEIELTHKLARMRSVRFYERPISYAGRSYAEGKKITWRDGLWALWCIARY